MKLWFEGWNVNAYDASPFRRIAMPAATAALTSAVNSLAGKGPREDSAANNFRQK
jgi:hypothetical protein